MAVTTPLPSNKTQSERDYISEVGVDPFKAEPGVQYNKWNPSHFFH